MSDLTELLERVKAATGPDRELDGNIYNALKPDYAAWAAMERNTTFFFWRDVFPYTGSIDAALALVERKLPGWEWQVRRTGYAELHHPTHHLKDEIGRAATPALAILAALLSALTSGASS